MMRFDPAAVLLQWAAGGLAFLWVTTRRREVGLGYGWLLRSVYAVLALGAFAAGLFLDDTGTGATIRDVASLAIAGAAGLALTVSVVRRRAGVSGQQARKERARARVAAMVDESPVADAAPMPEGAEYPPTLDLLAPAVGVVGLLGAAAASGGPYGLSAARLVVGAVFLGTVTDAMLLGHWYLVQPGLSRAPLQELVVWLAVVWPFEVAVYLLPTGMVSVLDGSIDDGWGGLLGWTWVACSVATIVLTGVTWAALRERYYSAVMAATGLLYLAILTALGQDLVARAVLAS